jgi:hypothetical protein
LSINKSKQLGSRVVKNKQEISEVIVMVNNLS